MGIFDGIQDFLGFGGGDPAALARNPAVSGEPAVPQAPQTFNDRLMNPLTQAGLALLANNGTRRSDRGAFEGVGEALTGAARLQEAKAEKNKTKAFLRQNYPHIADQVDAGLDVGEAFGMAMKQQQFDREMALRERLAKGRGDNLTADQRNFQLAQSNPEFAKFIGVGAKPPTLQTYYDDETGQERRGYWDPATGSMVPVGGSKAAKDSQGITIGPDGTVQIGGAGMKLTEGQSKDLNYYQRGSAALPTIDQNEDALSSAGQRFANGVPIGGNYLTSPEFQVGNQAGREFLTAILRKDTGAAITNQEFEIYAPMFLPQPGDSKEVLAQKRAARTRALEALKLGLGSATQLGDVPVTANPTSERRSGGKSSAGVSWSMED
ncbi:hypothetical protein [Aureimonas jatrophae]|uniref:Uncharacterized protein n=2 Tax=Aureimonas jatrophae TaxID=1166073 RepID=A0A1H0FS89_9HYPH|nr:hypothetical protein [Aureimonas jatrophae]SDN97349.1 hypothetical protein SAMN05192530_102644 [Aureimonas jatrophae]